MQATRFYTIEENQAYTEILPGILKEDLESPAERLDHRCEADGRCF